MITIGARAHDFGRLPAEILANRIAETGVQCIQLAISKALPDAPRYPADIDVHAVTKAFEQHQIGIAVLGCYINPVHPDPETREQELTRFEQHIQAAPEFHCTIVGTETGSRNPDCSFHPDTATEATYELFCESVHRLVRRAEQIAAHSQPVIIGIEPVADTHTISSPRLMQRLLKDIDSPSLGVIFDPVNLIGKTGVVSQDSFLDDCFASFGAHIVAIHAKDYRITEGSCGPIKSKSLPAGTGDLDWLGLFRRLRSIGKTDIPVLLEDLQPKEIPATKSRILDLWNQSALH
ncbi:sugar phosphate isomerase/epimerase [Gracilinema caldarium]|uniref:sugar phosphate isomerase/epimerase family protein n=1 Tax=Gracilinema caldarium TaxID=215591 RepID=UPI0026EF62CB|nr:sugar phosphate isomerase/epimerase family protein [Gracilinema caldarium]